jgi:hypothetical protein
MGQYDGDFERPDAAIVIRAREPFECAVEVAQLMMRASLSQPDLMPKHLQARVIANK